MTALVDVMVPDVRTALVAGGIALVVGAIAAATVARLRAGGMRVAYTRKLFHFAIFTAAALVHGAWGLPGTVVFGTVIAAIVLLGNHPPVEFGDVHGLDRFVFDLGLLFGFLFQGQRDV